MQNAEMISLSDAAMAMVCGGKKAATGSVNVPALDRCVADVFANPSLTSDEQRKPKIGQCYVDHLAITPLRGP